MALLYTKFKGREPSLMELIYDLSLIKSTDHCICTTEEIKNYIGRTFNKLTVAFVQDVKDLVLTIPTAPEHPHLETQ